MRKRGRVDANQSAIVKTLRSLGLSVWITSQMGDGGPDLVCGLRKRNYLFELKDESKPKSGKKLTDQESEFHASWRGQIDMIESAQEAIDIIFGKGA